MLQKGDSGPWQNTDEPVDCILSHVNDRVNRYVPYLRNSQYTLCITGLLLQYTSYSLAFPESLSYTVHMCDTICIQKHAAKIFAKNSDRQPDELQYTWYAGYSREELDHEHLTRNRGYQQMQLPLLKEALSRYEHPYPALLSTPSWCWGAEMGVNSQLVTIGNEAVFTCRDIPYRKQGLLGMDILRIALHNSGSAEQAVKIICSLINVFGQGGNGAYDGELYYHNSFLISDPNRTMILETADTHWALKEVDTSTSISNVFSLRRDHTACDEQSSGADFKRRYEDVLYSTISQGQRRLAFTRMQLLQAEASPAAARRICRSHISTDRHRGMHSICMHADRITRSETTSSLIVDISRRPGIHLSWGTCCPNPCIAVYQPFPLPRDHQEYSLLRESSFMTDRSSAGSYSRYLNSIVRAALRRGALGEDQKQSIRQTEDLIDRQTHTAEPESMKKAMEISEICYTACNEMYSSLADSLGVPYDERYNITTS